MYKRQAHVWRRNAFDQLLADHKRFKVRDDAASGFVLDMLGDAFFSNRDGAMSRAALDGKVLSGSFDATIKLWDPRTGACERTLGAPNFVYSLCVVGDKLVSGVWGGNILVWSTATWEVERTLPGHPGESVWALQQVGDVVVSAAEDSKLKLWGKRAFCHNKE